MGISWNMLAPLIALTITVAAMQVAVVLTDVIRSRDFRRFEDKSKEELTNRFPLPTVGPSSAEERRQFLAPLLNKAHKAAVVAQTTYYNAVVRSAGCLVLAFLSLALGVFPYEDWTLKAQSNRPSLELVLSWVDVIAIIAVLVLFLYGRKACRPWMAARAGTEFQRQFQILSLIFPSISSLAPTDDLKKQFDIETALVAARLQAGSITDIATRIEQFWSTRKALIESLALTEADVTTDALLVYLRRRARRQLGWFADSKERLEHIAERRKILLLSLYVITAGLVVIKHAIFLYEGHSPVYLLPLLLIVTGMSAAMTASYINQNSRSLIHRYNIQERAITSWLKSFNVRWKFSDLPSITFDLAAKNEIRGQIFRFEDLMIDELIDWIHITSHDAIELG